MQIGASQYFKDSRWIYYNGQRLIANSYTFTQIENSKYFRDSSWVFYEGEIISETPNSFLLEKNAKNIDAIDNLDSFFQGKKINQKNKQIIVF
jgi:hypothetical protein